MTAPPSGLQRAVEIIGSSPAIKNMKSDISDAAPYNVNVLATGPTGAGKELVAQAIHNQSGRKGPLVSVNCAAIPRDLLEAELFGHEKGAFTGATARRIGRFEEANDGTLFLDEIGDMPLNLQAKLLRVIEARSISRIGSNKETPVSFRLVCATHQDLKAKSARSLFRADLMFRLSVIIIRVPPLNERLEDVPDLITAISQEMETGETGLVPPPVEQDGLDELMQYDWPGNIRELKNFFQRAAVLSRGKPIGRDCVRRLLHGEIPRADEEAQLWDAIQTLPFTGSCNASIYSDEAAATDLVRDNIREVLEDSAFFPLKEHLAKQERDIIEIALEMSNYNTAQAAKHLDLKRTTLIAKMNKYGIGSVQPAEE